jgi:predicted SnoaL-like aldol condensation-catalyzing enzyme
MGGEMNKVDIAIRFIEAFRDGDWDKAREVMHKDMIHVSPTDRTVGAEAFIEYYRTNFSGNGWRYEFIDSIAEGDRVALRYRSIIPGMYDSEMVEWFEIRESKIVRADNYLAKIPGDRP